METGAHGQTPRSQAIETFKRYFTHELRVVAGALDSQSERVERLERELVQFIASLGIQPVAATGPGVAGAEPRISHIGYWPSSDGSAEFALDGRKKFKLTPQLTEIFLFIASGEANPDGKDPMVGWRSRAEILDHLSRIFGRSYAKRFVNNLVNRLKDALSKAEYSRMLIQTHRRKGVRLACRRGALDGFDVDSR